MPYNACTSLHWPLYEPIIQYMYKALCVHVYTSHEEV